MATRATAVLPGSDAKMQFQTPFVTTELNRKSVGIVPAGIYRGFSVSALGFNVTVAADPGTGDSVAVCKTINASLLENQYNVTVRHEGDIVIDYSGVTVSPTVLVLEARYDLTSPTPVEGLTEVRIKAVDPGDVMPYHVVLATVSGAPAPPIVDTTSADITGGPLVTPVDLVTSSMKMASLVKTDGSFSLFGLSSAFVDFPGANSVTFTPSLAGASALILVHGNTATQVSNPEVSSINLNVDGLDVVAGTEGDGVAAGVSVQGLSFQLHQGCGINAGGGSTTAMWRLSGLTASSHTVKLRATVSGFLGGIGRFYASPAVPFTMTVLYS